MSTAVLIVNYKAYDDLARCLSSLVTHLQPTDEVVVVDYESDPQALAAAHARAPFLLLLNPDTVTDTPVIRVLEEWLTSHPDVAVVGARVYNASGSVQPSARRFPDLTTLFGGRSTWLTSQFPSNWFPAAISSASTARRRWTWTGSRARVS